jgi:hypothetical protein
MRQSMRLSCRDRLATTVLLRSCSCDRVAATVLARRCCREHAGTPRVGYGRRPTSLAPTARLDRAHGSARPGLALVHGRWTHASCRPRPRALFRGTRRALRRPFRERRRKRGHPRAVQILSWPRRTCMSGDWPLSATSSECGTRSSLAAREVAVFDDDWEPQGRMHRARAHLQWKSADERLRSRRDAVISASWHSAECATSISRSAQLQSVLTRGRRTEGCRGAGGADRPMGRGASTSPRAVWAPRPRRR